MSKFLISGVNGLVGSKLSKALTEKGDTVIGLIRSASSVKTIQATELVEWSLTDDELIKIIETVDYVIHLAGYPVAKNRWTEKIKNQIYNSRVKTTERLAQLIVSAKNKPKAFIVASAVGYYGTEIDKVSTEKSSPGTDFLSKVAKDWEEASFPVDKANVRRVNIRISTVLSLDGGALPKMIIPFKFFAGAILGSGKQYFSWIHENDLINMFLFIINNDNIFGPINAVSPHSITMEEFSRTLAKVLHKPCFFRIPNWAMRILFGEMSEILIGGGKVIPEVALNYGFKFQFENLQAALTDLFSKPK